jgi:hypothetical protein
MGGGTGDGRRLRVGSRRVCRFRVDALADGWRRLEGA